MNKETYENPLQLGGKNIEKALDLIKERTTNPKKRYSDERRLIIVAEGGAMRGVVSAGVLSGLAILGGQKIFDAIYTTSAASINAAHFLSGRGLERAATYHKFLADKRFYNPLRLGKIADISYVTDKVLKELNPLDYVGFIENETPLFSTFYSTTTNRTLCLEIPKVETELFEHLNAAISIPVIGKSKYKIQGEKMCDGALEAQLAIDFAMEDSPTDILVILSHDPKEQRKPSTFLQKVLFYLFFAKGNPEVYKILGNRGKQHRRQTEICLPTSAVDDDLNIATFYPSPQHISNLERNSNKLRIALSDYTKQTLDYFGNKEKKTHVDDLVEKEVF